MPLADDRYPPYRDKFNRASRVAYVFHRSEPRARPEQVLPSLVAQGGRVERAEIAGFTVLIHERSPEGVNFRMSRVSQARQSRGWIRTM